MRGRCRGAVAVLIVLASCTATDRSSRDVAATPSAPQPSQAPAIADLPRKCSGLGKPHNEVTFVARNRLYAARQDGSGLRCLVRATEGQDLKWGPAADRAFMLTSLGGRMLLDGVDRFDQLGYAPQAIPQGWSRPHGTSFLWISPDNKSLLKVDAATSVQQEVTFLARTDEAIYHPAGEHILAIGEDDKGTYGVFLATNEGTEAQPLVVGESARHIYSLAFGVTGSLYYAAEHPTHYDVHRVTFHNSPDTGTVKTQLQTLYTTTEPIAGISVSPFLDEQVAVQVGTCDSKTIIPRGSINGPVMGPRDTERLQDAAVELPDPLNSLSTQPIGWLPHSRLILQARDGGCEGPSDLYVSRDQRTKLLVDQVDVAAVRVELPDPPPPPTAEPEVVA